MRNLKKLAALVTAAVLSLSISIPAFAAVEDTGFADVDASAWYAEEAVWCRDRTAAVTRAASFFRFRMMGSLLLPYYSRFWFPVDHTCCSLAAAGVFWAMTPTSLWGT